jgi:hypothetical protein
MDARPTPGTDTNSASLLTSGWSSLGWVVGGHLGDDVCSRDRDGCLRRARKSRRSRQRSAGRPHSGHRKRATGRSGRSIVIGIHASRNSERVAI